MREKKEFRSRNRIDCLSIDPHRFPHWWLIHYRNRMPVITDAVWMHDLEEPKIMSLNFKSLSHLKSCPSPIHMIIELDESLVHMMSQRMSDSSVELLVNQHQVLNGTRVKDLCYVIRLSSRQMECRIVNYICVNWIAPTWWTSWSVKHPTRIWLKRFLHQRSLIWIWSHFKSNWSLHEPPWLLVNELNSSVNP